MSTTLTTPSLTPQPLQPPPLAPPTPSLTHQSLICNLPPTLLPNPFNFLPSPSNFLPNPFNPSKSLPNSLQTPPLLPSTIYILLKLVFCLSMRKWYHSILIATGDSLNYIQCVCTH